MTIAPPPQISGHQWTELTGNTGDTFQCNQAQFFLYLQHSENPNLPENQENALRNALRFGEGQMLTINNTAGKKNWFKIADRTDDELIDIIRG